MLNLKGANASKISPSLRVALIAFALSLWFEGYAQLRHSVTAAALFDSRLFSFTLSLDEGEPDFGRTNEDHGPQSPRKNPFWNWLTRRGRRMDDAERGIMGTLDILTSLGLLHVLRTGPLLPFLLTPLMTSIPLPDSQERVASLRWSKLILISLALCLVREMERCGVAQAVSTYRRNKDERDGVYTGRKVVIRGAPLPLRRRAPSSSSPSTNLSWMYETDEEEPECIICTGNAGNADLSQSVTSVSSHVSSASRTSAALSETGASGGGFGGSTLPSSSSDLGPLEAFCSVAPTKHVAHRGCILRWHAAYNESQRQRMPPVIFRPNGDVEMPDAVSVVEEASPADDSMTPEKRAQEAQRKLRRAEALLKLARFEYLLDNLRVIDNRALNTTPYLTTTTPLSSGASALGVGSSTPTSASARSPFRPFLTLAPFSTHQPSLRSGPSNSRHIQPLVPPSTSSASTFSYASTPDTISIPKNHLATLRTEWPPCPGCRSPIDLHFCAPTAPSRSSSRPSPSRGSSRTSMAEGALSISEFMPRGLLSIIAAFRSQIDKRNTTRLVTGRAIALSLSAQLSFLMTILSMMHARERAHAALETLELEMRARRATRA